MRQIDGCLNEFFIPKILYLIEQQGEEERYQ